LIIITFVPDQIQLVDGGSNYGMVFATNAASNVYGYVCADDISAVVRLVDFQIYFGEIFLPTIVTLKIPPKGTVSQKITGSS
jgi:hypothetical protein